MILHCMKSKESAPVSSTKNKQYVNWNTKKENQPQYESMIVLTAISVTEFIRNTFNHLIINSIL